MTTEDLLAALPLFTKKGNARAAAPCRFPAERRGFVIVETDDLQELANACNAYGDLMSWQIHPFLALDYATVVQTIRGVRAATA